MNIYQMILNFFASMTFGGPTLRQACLDGTLPVSYRHARRLVKRAQKRGDLLITRAADEQGQPLKGVKPQ